MSLEIRRWWYGQLQVNGHRTIVNLGVPITGERPPKRTMVGDDEFERSRGRAMEAYAKQRQKLQEDRTGEKTLQKLAELKTGREVNFPKLAELADYWTQIPRRKAPDERYAHQCRVRLEAFARFVAEHQRDASKFVSVKPATARAFMAAEEARGVSPKTWNDTLKLLRATFKHLHPQLDDGSNPFHGLVTKATETVTDPRPNWRRVADGDPRSPGRNGRSVFASTSGLSGRSPGRLADATRERSRTSARAAGSHLEDRNISLPETTASV